MTARSREIFERLEAEANEADNWMGIAGREKARADAAEAEVRRLREALAPFAAIADHFERAHTSSTSNYGDVLHGFRFVPGESVELRLSDCKRAKEVLG